MLKDYGEVKRSAEDRVAWRAITRQLLPKKMTHDDDESLLSVAYSRLKQTLHTHMVLRTGHQKGFRNETNES